MAKIAMEWKLRLNRPKLDGIVGAALRTNPDVVKIIVRCKFKTSAVDQALREGYPVPVEVVTDNDHS